MLSHMYVSQQRPTGNCLGRRTEWARRPTPKGRRRIVASHGLEDNAGGAIVNPIPQVSIVGILTSSGLVVVEVPR